MTMILCDSAQVADGKLYILGGGWSLTGPDPAPSAIAMKLEIDWNEADSPHHWELYLEDADGHPVLVPGPEGVTPIEVRGDFQVGRPPGLAPGSPIDLPLAVSVGPLPLEAGTRYAWRLVMDGEGSPDWALSFTTRPRLEAEAVPPPGPGPA
ncbi:MAG TPA: hypothetical protein VMU63_03730 [Acidimicrobiales bacterium]|nr:hypothetical protein [Acidimicrobiales bacterium]